MDATSFDVRFIKFITSLVLYITNLNSEKLFVSMSVWLHSGTAEMNKEFRENGLKIIPINNPTHPDLSTKKNYPKCHSITP